jgi:hypothetical protein
LRGTIKCVLSWLLVASFYALIWSYKDRVISPSTKALFDAIVVALTIVFSINIISGLKEIAIDLRWWVLGLQRRTAREVCPISGPVTLKELKFLTTENN